MTTDDPQKIKARLSEVAADVRDVYQDAVCCINELQAERDQARSDRNGLHDSFRAASDHVTSLTERLHKALAEADSLKAERDEFEAIGNRSLEKVRELDTENAALKAKLARDFPCCDTPTDQQEPERREERIESEEIQAGDVVDVWTNGTADYFTGLTFQELKFSSPAVSTLVFSDSQELQDIHPCDDTEIRLIHRPTPSPVTAEMIRASEPGATWTWNGWTAEWDGKHIRTHWHDGTLGPEMELEWFTDRISKWHRSSAAPRGDYGKQFRMADWEREMLEQEAAEKVKVELPTEPGEVILVTEIDNGRKLDPAVFAMLDDDGEWFRCDHKYWPDTGSAWDVHCIQPSLITGWRSAKVVTDE